MIATALSFINSEITLYLQQDQIVQMVQTFQKKLYLNFQKQPSMRIEKDEGKLSLAFSGYEYQAIAEEMSEPYDLSQIQGENMDISVSVTDGARSNNLDIDCSEFDLDYFQLSEEQEMLLDFLLPGRQSNRERCIKSVSYIEFISSSIKQYKNSLALNNSKK